METAERSLAGVGRGATCELRRGGLGLAGLGGAATLFHIQAINLDELRTHHYLTCLLRGTARPRQAEAGGGSRPAPPPLRKKRQGTVRNGEPE